jgi:RNA polymerase sigma factor (sigma-70 family)
MATAQLHKTLRHLRRALLQDAGLTDGQLLGAFLEQRDEAAFAALVRRHGPMVLGVCCRVVGHHHDAEDAFQTTFLVLARKASSVVPREMLGNWLHGVAYQTARKARAMSIKQRAREKQVVRLPEPAAPPPDPGDDLSSLLDRELGQLPAKYRLPIVLCDLEGQTRKEAARRLGWPEGTVSSRLARGRALLGRRLARRGVVAGLLALGVAQQATSAALPPALLAATVTGAALVASGRMLAPGTFSAKVVALTQEVLKSMLLAKLKLTATLVLLLGLLGGVAGLLLTAPPQPAAAQQPPLFPANHGPDSPKSRDAPQEKSIQGNWTLLRVERDGRGLKVEAGSVELVVTNQFLIWKEQGQDRGFTYKLDPAKGPGQIDLTSLVEGADKGRLIRGIYALEGDRLMICESDGARPTEFGTRSGSPYTLFVYERAALGRDLPRDQPTPDGPRGKRFSGAGDEFRVVPRDQPTPRAEQMFPEGTEHDFGNVSRGLVATHTWPLTNTYASALKVVNVRSSCGCLTAEVSKQVLQPLERGNLTVRVDTGRFTGVKQIRIYLTFDRGGLFEEFSFSVKANSQEPPDN